MSLLELFCDVDDFCSVPKNLAQHSDKTIAQRGHLLISYPNSGYSTPFRQELVGF